MSTPTPLERLADSYKGGDPVNDTAILLMRAWAKAEPESGVSQHPASYVATFADMARAVAPALSTPTTPDEGEEARAREVLAAYGDFDGDTERDIIRAMLAFASCGRA